SGRELTPKVKDILAEAIGELQPVGWTPLALAISKTGGELRKRKTLCEFIVITDGMETCGGDPALEAKKLNRALNLPSGVNVILFGGDDNEKDAVKKIADEGGGKYYDASSFNALLLGIDDVKERTKVAAKVRAATDQARRAESSAEEAEEAAATAKKSAEQAAELGADAKEAQPMAGRAQRSAREASAAAVEAREASGEAKKAADTARGMKSEADAAAQVQIASGAADKAADKAKEAQAAAEDTREAAKGVRLALAEARKPREEPKTEEKEDLDEITKALIEDLKDKQTDVRKRAAESLQKRKAKAAAPALSERVADDIWDSRYTVSPCKRAALDALKALAPDQAQGALLKARKSKNTEVRGWATTELGKLKL